MGFKYRWKPVAASYSNRVWDHQSVFKWINNILSANNGADYVIRWYRTVEECKTQCEKPKSLNTNKEPLKSAEELQLPWKD